MSNYDWVHVFNRYFFEGVKNTKLGEEKSKYTGPSYPMERAQHHREVQRRTLSGREGDRWLRQHLARQEGDGH